MDEFLRRTPVQVATCGIIFQEVLQGLRLEEEFQRVKVQLLKLPWFETTQGCYLSAARLSRKARSSGVALTSVDALIASVTIANRALLWTLDEDFVRIRNHSRLQLYE